MSTYEVGYRKPPSVGQFKKGNKEWTKRKPKKQIREGDLFRAIMSENVPVRQGKGVKYQSRAKLAVDGFAAAAARGDLRAADMMLKLHNETLEIGEMIPVTLVFEDVDRKL
jgi:hypothetical protein